MPTRDEIFIADMNANPHTLKNRLRLAIIERGEAWLTAVLQVGGVNRLADLTPGEAEEMLAIPAPPDGVDGHVVHEFLKAIRQFLYDDGQPPDALDRRTDADLWLCGLISDVRA